jgi:hypothetical protein
VGSVPAVTNSHSLHRKVTANDSWRQHFDRQREPQNVEWRHKTSSKKNKQQSKSSAHETTGIFSWGAEGWISVELLPQEETITAARYEQTLRNFLLHCVTNVQETERCF